MKNIFATKNRHISTFLALILLSTFYLPPIFAQFPFPEGAIEVFGKGQIYDMQYSPDGTRLAVATTMGIWIYDTTTYKILYILEKQEDLVERIVFSPDGSIFASEERFDKIHLWDVNTGKHKYKLDHRGGIKHFDFSADGQTLVTLRMSGPSINTIFYHVDTGAKKQVKSMDMNHVDFIQAYHTTFDRNNNILATGELDNTIYLWDLVEGVRKKTFKGNKGSLYCLAFSPDGKTLAGGGQNYPQRGDDGNFRSAGTLNVWDAVKGKRKHRFSGENMFNIRSVAFSPDGSLLAGGDEFGQIHLVDPNTGKYIKRLEGHNGEVVAISFSADMRTFASGSKDGSIRIWDVASGENKQTLDGFFNELTSFDISTDGKTILMAGKDRNVCLWDITAGKREKTFTKEWENWKNPVRNIAFIPGGNRILIMDNAKFLWDRNTGKPAAHFLRPNRSVISMGISPDGKKIVTGSSDGTVLLFDVERRNYKGQVSLAAHAGRVTSVAYSSDGKTIVTGSEDTTIKLWDANTTTEKKVFTGHKRGIKDVALSADGQTIAAVDGTATIYLWDVETSGQKRFRTGRASNVLSVAFSPDGKRLAAGDIEGAVYVLDAASGISQRRFIGHEGHVEIVAFASDGKVLANLNEGGVIFLWDVASLF